MKLKMKQVVIVFPRVESLLRGQTSITHPMLQGVLNAVLILLLNIASINFCYQSFHVKPLRVIDL